MRLLALETSTERLSLAILNGEEVIAREIDAGQRHSELAIAALTGLLRDAECTLADLDAIAFGRGPGSFVGVRIACGFAQGLAMGAGKPLLPVVTLMAMAEQADNNRVLVAVDARMGEFYIAAYERSDTDAKGWNPVIAPMLARADQLPVLNGTGWCGIGSAFDVPALRCSLADRYAHRLENVRYGRLPSAAQIACIAARQLARAGNDLLSVAEPSTPLYLRNHVALTIAERRVVKAGKERAQKQSAATEIEAQRVALPDVAA